MTHLMISIRLNDVFDIFFLIKHELVEICIKWKIANYKNLKPSEQQLPDVMQKRRIYPLILLKIQRTQDISDLLKKTLNQ